VPSPPAVEVRDLAKAYAGIPALTGLSFSVPPAQVTAVLGPNGAGKTTTLEICEGYRSHDSGDVLVLGRKPRDPQLRPRVGVQLQAGGIPPGASARDSLAHISRLYRHPLDVNALAGRLGIDEFGSTNFRRLSGGQQRLVTLALALVGRPELVLLDEPTSGLDPHARRLVWEVIDEVRSAGVSVMLSTHHLDEAERLADHVVMIDRGRCVAQGSVTELTDASQQRLTLRLDTAIDVHSLQLCLPPACHIDLDATSPMMCDIRGTVDAQVLASVAQWCRDHGVTPRDLSLHGASLEEAYLRLTGGHDDQS
jgi:ABC-2 type transport system ATP-binding protein